MALVVNERCGDVLGSVRSGLHFRASAWFILPVMTTPYGQIYAQRLGSIYCTSGLPSCPGGEDNKPLVQQRAPRPLRRRGSPHRRVEEPPTFRAPAKRGITATLRR